VFYNASAVPQRPAGAGVYTLELGRSLAARDDVQLRTASPRDFGFGEWTPTPAGIVRRLLWEEWHLSRAPELSECDVYHGPHFLVPKTGIPSVATVHDLTFFRIPARYTFRHRRYYRHLARTAARAHRIIVPSAAVAGDCVKYLGYAPERIRVVAEAPRAGIGPADAGSLEAFRQRHAIAGSYFACLGTAEPGKRAVDAIRALPAILAKHADVTLALGGNVGPLTAPLAAEAQRLGVEQSVRFLGYVPDDQLSAFLTGATALIFPSVYEGFGLPPLEALACGTPVIATDAPALSELLRRGVSFVPRRDPRAIARACLRMLDAVERASLGAAGREFAARFSGERAAAETVAVYREVAP
jgi:alpha-1,3-rhamnosyl/mannosyltransferase